MKIFIFNVEHIILIYNGLIFKSQNLGASLIGFVKRYRFIFAKKASP